MTAPMVDYKIHWLKMMSVPESRAVVGRHDGINGRDTRAYVARRTLEGLSKREIMRCLKRYVAREIYRVLTAPSSA